MKLGKRFVTVSVLACLLLLPTHGQKSTQTSITSGASRLLKPDAPEMNRRAPELFYVRLETSKGVILIEIHRDWAPHGVDRFYNLVRAGYYDGARFFRVIKGRWAQFGVHGDPKVSNVWRARKIVDDPRRESNVRGAIAYAFATPNGRTTQVFINLQDNSAAHDREPFAPFGRIIEGMDVADALNAEYGESSGGGIRAGKQGPLFEGGNEYLKRNFPRLDYILRATVHARRVIPEKISPRLSVSDEAFLEDLSRRSFRFFWEQSDPHTGLALDRARVDGSPPDESHREVASIASTGFGLTALCIAAKRRWVDPNAARERVRATLRFFAERSPHEHGWFYHFVNFRTGAREWKSEISSIDTALLLGGVLTARRYFRADREIARLATKIYDRVDFQWMLNGHPTLLSHGWRPESGFIRSRWDNYSEHTMLYLMAIGSPTNPITPESWYAWERDWVIYAGFKYLASASPLFIHQYSHAWVDYRGRRETREPRLDYFENSVIATRAHRAFCMDLKSEFAGYSANVWGVTASDSAMGNAEIPKAMDLVGLHTTPSARRLLVERDQSEISTASGSERGSRSRSLAGAALANARGTDSLSQKKWSYQELK